MEVIKDISIIFISIIFESLPFLLLDDDYGDIAVIDVINVKEIKSFNESLYVYPCTSYGNGSCDILKEINYE